MVLILQMLSGTAVIVAAIIVVASLLSVQKLIKLEPAGLGGSNIFGIGPSVSLSLFNAGHIASNVELERSRSAEAAARYRSTVPNDLSETEDALARHGRKRQRLILLEAEVTQEQDALNLSQVQYKAGLVDFTTVLNSERSLQAAEDQAAQSRVAITTDLIATYKALGGGWEIAPNEQGKL